MAGMYEFAARFARSMSRKISTTTRSTSRRCSRRSLHTAATAWHASSRVCHIARLSRSSSWATDKTKPCVKTSCRAPSSSLESLVTVVLINAQRSSFFPVLASRSAVDRTRSSPTAASRRCDSSRRWTISTSRTSAARTRSNASWLSWRIRSLSIRPACPFSISRFKSPCDAARSISTCFAYSCNFSTTRRPSSNASPCSIPCCLAASSSCSFSLNTAHGTVPPPRPALLCVPQV